MALMEVDFPAVLGPPDRAFSRRRGIGPGTSTRVAPGFHSGWLGAKTRVHRSIAERHERLVGVGVVVDGQFSSGRFLTFLRISFARHPDAGFSRRALVVV